MLSLVNGEDPKNISGVISRDSAMSDFMARERATLINNGDADVYRNKANSLFEIKFLYIKAIEMIIIKGMVSEIILGILRSDNNKKVFKFIDELFSIILEISIIFINNIKIVKIIIFCII